jgi:PHD/YefM family antitoxin component YafN of YafNO toxin-antitoxin module
MISTLPGTISAVAPVTDLRSATNRIIDHAIKKGAVMIQKNNEPRVVVVAVAEYIDLVNKASK